MANQKKLSSIIVGNPDDDEIVKNVEQKIDVFMRENRNTRRQWLVNAAFSRGQQFCVLHNTDDRLMYMKAQPGRKLIMDDRIGPWKEYSVSSIVAALPEFQAEPESLDSDAIQSARVGSGLLEHYWREWQFKSKYITLAGHMQDFGNAIAYVNYTEDGNKYISRTVQDPETGEQITDDNGAPVVVKTPYGDVDCTILPPHCLACPLDDSPLREKPWVALIFRRSREHLFNVYGRIAEDLVESVADKYETRYDDYGIRRINRDHENILAHGQDTYINEMVYFQKPCYADPDGRVIVVAGKKVLLNEKWPYERLLSYPIVHFQYPTCAGEFFGRSPVERQITLQKMINLVWSILAENYDDMVHLKWLVPNQSEVAEITDDNAIIRYNHPFAPQQSDVRPLPNWALTILDYLKSAMQDAQHYHGASMGGAVAGVRAGSHANALQEQDLLPLSLVDEKIHDGFAELGEIILKIASETLSDERFITYTGATGVQQIMKFRKDMLGSVSKVNVRMTGRYMRSPSATEQVIIQMGNMGLLVDSNGIPDTNRILRLLEFRLPESEFDEMRRQTGQAYYSLSLLESGKEVPVLPWQNHKMILQVFEDYMNSAEFLAKMQDPDPTVQTTVQNVINHWQQRSQLYMKNLSMLQNPQSGSQPKREPANASENKPANQNNRTRKSTQ